MSTTLSFGVKRGPDLGRLFGSGWFGLLAIVTAWGLRIKLDAAASVFDLPALASGLCVTFFYVVLALLILMRPTAKAQTPGLLPKTAALVGTYMPWAMPFFGKITDVPVLNLLSIVCVLVGMAMTLVTIRHLGKSWSLVPQARSVVMSGPYRWIRHPLYLSEEIAILGVVFQYLSVMTLLVLAVHVAIQVCRIRYEEALLGRTFPDYRTYAASRWRLLPGVW